MQYCIDYGHDPELAYCDHSFEEPELKYYSEKCGVFRAGYLVEDDEPENCCGFLYWKHNNIRNRKTIINFFKGEELIFSRETAMKAMLIMYGDGETENNTFFVVNDNFKLSIYNMKNELVREPFLCSEFPIALKKVSDKYAICIGDDMCGSKQGSLINLDMFFGFLNDGESRAYDDSREPIYMNWNYFTYKEDYKGSVVYMPVYAKPEGFIVMNLYTKEILPTPVSYDDAFFQKFDFYDDEKYKKELQNSLDIIKTVCGVDIDANTLTTLVLNNGGSLSIPVKNDDTVYLPQVNDTN